MTNDGARRANPILRPAIPADTASILRLIRGLAAYEHLLDQVTATEAGLHDVLFAPEPRAHAIVAASDNEPIGMALFYYTLNTFRLRRGIFLEDLFVEPSWRGRGIGLSLMRSLAQRAVAEGCGGIEWRVLHWNQRAIDFYQRIGAEPVRDWQTRQLGGDALVCLAKGIPHG